MTPGPAMSPRTWLWSQGGRARLRSGAMETLRVKSFWDRQPAASRADAARTQSAGTGGDAEDILLMARG